MKEGPQHRNQLSRRFLSCAKATLDKDVPRVERISEPRPQLGVAKLLLDPLSHRLESDQSIQSHT